MSRLLKYCYHSYNLCSERNPRHRWHLFPHVPITTIHGNCFLRCHFERTSEGVRNPPYESFERVSHKAGNTCSFLCWDRKTSLEQLLITFSSAFSAFSLCRSRSVIDVSAFGFFSAEYLSLSDVRRWICNRVFQKARLQQRNKSSSFRICRLHQRLRRSNVDGLWT